MNKLEGVRLEVDSRRRTVAELGQKIDKQRARLPQTKSKGEFDIEQTIKKVQHKENKLAGESKLSPVFVVPSWLVGCASCHIHKQCETCCCIALQNANTSLYMLFITVVSQVMTTGHLLSICKLRHQFSAVLISH